MKTLKRLAYSLTHPLGATRILVHHVQKATGYSRDQWQRVAMYGQIERQLATLPAPGIALEISGGNLDAPWVRLYGARMEGLDYPEFDICTEIAAKTYDFIVLDQVFEHLADPEQAAKNLYAMLNPNGRVLITTPFLIRYHPTPIDCSRWTEIGMKHLLMRAGFAADRIETHSWGNRDVVIANLKQEGWAEYGYGKSLRNDPAFPLVVWAYAQRGED